ncbi:Kalirin [Tupaia chinensis]|uniref:Kalirin n=1 Tax=Tupaia chinensis TaxID=246437 RepID=L9KGN2_TUPCH|nr:Kalirin [Tupaia chinensis]
MQHAERHTHLERLQVSDLRTSGIHVQSIPSSLRDVSELSVLMRELSVAMSAGSGEDCVDNYHLSGGCELTVVLQDFSAGHSSELTVQVGQTVELLERPSERPGWCLVRTTERSPPQEGLVPSSTLCISHSRSSVEMECFFPLVKGWFFSPQA